MAAVAAIVGFGSGGGSSSRFLGRNGRSQHWLYTGAAASIAP